jgi:ABC-type multidrug transport system fused ATPase/permease subunit
LALQIFLSLITTLWISLVFYSTGDLIRRVGNYNCTFLLEKVVINISLGFGVSGFLIMLLNLAGIVSPVIIISLLALVSLFFIRKWIDIFFATVRKLSHLNYHSFDKLYLIPVALITLYFLRSLLPPSGFDALMYHLSCAQLYLEHGGFYNLFFNPQSDFPMLAEMNYQIGLAFNNDLICRQISFLADCLACGSMLLFCKYLNLGSKASVVAISVLLSMPVMIASISTCDVDLPLAAWIVLSVYTLLHIDTISPAKKFLLPAFFAGMAVSTKIFGVFVFPLLLMIIIYKKYFVIKNLLTLLVVPSSMGLPWFLKSFIHKGTILSIKHSHINSQGLGLPMGIYVENPVIDFLVNVFLRITAAPWTFSLIPSQHQQEMLGPLFIALLPFAFLIKLPPQPKILLQCSGIYLACILLMEMFFIPAGASIRYVLVIILFCIPVCILIIKEFRRYNQFIYKLILLMIAVQISLGSILFVKRYHKDWIALLTLKSRDSYYESILPEYPAIEFMNNLQSSSKIMTTLNFDNYLIKRPYISVYKHYSTTNELSEDLKKHAITHIFANNVLDTTANAKIFPYFTNKKMVFSENGFCVFEIVK